MAKLSNLLVMIELLKTGRKYNLDELSKYLEVSERTIREYKLFLEEAGIYVDTIRGPYGGYILRQEINIPTLNYNDSDANTIKEAIKHISNNNLRDKLIDISNKISSNVLDEENKNKKLVTDDKELLVYNTLSKAIRNNYKVRIKYYNLQHGESVRIIYPLGLYLFQNEWWCSSYWEEKDDMRQFHIKRILEAEILDSKFDPNEINVKF